MLSNKEAISILYHLKKCLNDNMFFEALDLAIKALEINKQFDNGEEIDEKVYNPCQNCQEFDCYDCVFRRTENEIDNRYS